MIKQKFCSLLVAKINLSFTKKKLWFEIRYTKIFKQLLQIFYSQGIINGFSIFFLNKKKKIRVFLNYNNLETLNFIPLKLYFLSSLKISISLMQLKYITKHLGLSRLILSTNLGFLTHEECLKHNTSGFLCFILYN